MMRCGFNEHIFLCYLLLEVLDLYLKLIDVSITLEDFVLSLI